MMPSRGVGSYSSGEEKRRNWENIKPFSAETPQAASGTANSSSLLWVLMSLLLVHQLC